MGNTPNEDLFVSVILDRSGSMEAVRDDTIGAFNTFLADLRGERARTVLTLTQFDTGGIDVVCDAVPVAEVRPLDHTTFVPRGMTPLLDAVGITLERTRARAAGLGWRPDQLLVAIITDGQENSSREWTRAALLARVEELCARGWGFVFLGVGPETFAEAGAIGVPAGSTARYAHSRAGMTGVGKTLSSVQKKFRTKSVMAEALIDEAERREMEGRP